MSWNLLKNTVQNVTDEIIHAIQNQDLKFTDMWTKSDPVNIATGNRYNGYNLFSLMFVTKYFKYKEPWFLTFKQAQELGGGVMRGSRGHKILRLRPRTKDDQEEESKRTGYVPYTSTVFNLDQTDGIDMSEFMKNYKHNDILDAENIIKGYVNGPKIINHDPNNAYYSVMNDAVNMVDKSKFGRIEDYYSVFFHELVHSTGHHTRLKRFSDENKNAAFGTINYSKEELIAELGASYLCSRAGIIDSTMKNSAAYIKGWASVLKDDKQMIYGAMSQAMYASAMILNIDTKKN